MNKKIDIELFNIHFIYNLKKFIKPLKIRKMLIYCFFGMNIFKYFLFQMKFLVFPILQVK